MWRRLLMSWGGGSALGGRNKTWLAPSRSPFRGQPVSGDDLPMTLYHLTPEGPGVTLSYQLESRLRRGRREDEWHGEREEEEKNGAREEGRHKEALGGVKMENKTVGMRFDWAPGLPLLHKMADEKMCFYSSKARPDGRFLSLPLPFPLSLSPWPLSSCPQVGWKVDYIISI